MAAPTIHTALLGALIMYWSQTKPLDVCFQMHWPYPTKGHRETNHTALLTLTWTQQAHGKQTGRCSKCFKYLDNPQRINMACSSSNWRKQRSGKQEDNQLSSLIPSAIEERTCNECVKIKLYSIIQHCTAKGQTCCCHWRCSEHIDTCSRWQPGQLQSWNWTLFSGI